MNPMHLSPLASGSPVASPLSSLPPIAAQSTSSRGHTHQHVSQLALVGVAVAHRRAQRRGAQHKAVMGNGTGDVAIKPGQDKYEDLVSEGRMITIEESNIRYAGALVIFLIGVYKYANMMSSGVYDYNAIAANAWGVYVLFESGRQSI